MSDMVEKNSFYESVKNILQSEAIIQSLSKQLTVEFGKGFSKQNLWNMRQFYSYFPILSAVRRELTWTHYKTILRIENKQTREWYMNEAVEANWSTRALERQIGSHYYDRIVASRDKSIIKEEAKENTKSMQKDNKNFRESDLESALIDKVQDFLLELGRGFAFVSRQKHIRTELSDFYIDLVFYNYILKCFVIIDLKKASEDNPTIGIILCTDKDHTVVKYSSIDNEKLFVSKYQLYLPTEEELKAEIEKDILELELSVENNE